MHDQRPLRMQASPDARAARSERLLSLDAFRGLTIAAMILVVSPGSYARVYAPLRHAKWNGCTFADLIFPFFLFIVGMAITLSFSQRLARGDSRLQLARKIAWRTVLIFAIGMFLHGFPGFDGSDLRIPGVLQRIAVCYAIAAVIALNTGPRGQALIAAAILVGYWALMKYVPVPGYGTGQWTPEGNLAAYIDRAVLGGHLLHDSWDPEGILGTLPAVATTLFGVLAGTWIRQPRSQRDRLIGLLIAANAAVGLGLLANHWFPINKSLWTSSYVLFTAGVAMDALAACFWLIDIRGHRSWATPCLVYGANPLPAYVFSSLMTKVLLLWHLTLANGSRVTAKRFVFKHVFLRAASPLNASLLYALAYVALWWALMAILYRRRIFIRL